MNCCGRFSSAQLLKAPVRRPGLFANLTRVFRWITLGITLVFVPKCLLCLSAYVVVGTGIGMDLAKPGSLKDAGAITICSVPVLHSEKAHAGKDNGKNNIWRVIEN